MAATGRTPPESSARRKSASPKGPLKAQTVASAACVAVAVSGGRDSTALLHATLRTAAPLGLRVVALHVHHGLNPLADEWQRHVRNQCARWRRTGWPLAFCTERLAGTPAAGQSVEAWARAGRYGALVRMAQAQGATLLLLAHHRRDQAETVLLQALRGAGPAGLAAMPAGALRQGLTWARPWLDQPAQAIDAYVRRHRLRHIDDDSNNDTRFDRNRLRHGLWPQLLAAFPRAENSLAQSARQQQRAAALIDEVAAADALALQREDGALEVARWLGLSAPRRWFCIKAWLQALLPMGVPDSLLARLADELPATARGSARWPAAQGAELQLHCGLLRLGRVPPPQRAAGPESAPGLAISGGKPGTRAGQAASEGAAAGSSTPMTLERPGRYPLPAWHGELQVTRVAQGGLPQSLLAHAELRDRQGGEAFQRSLHGIARSLKKQFQAAGLPAWQRGGPLVLAQGRLLWVPGLGPDARALAQPGEPQCRLDWWPDLDTPGH